MILETDRREVLRGVGALALAGALAGCDALAQAAPRRPNIIFILADDLGYADVGCYGQRDYPTPRIDSLAATGVRLTQGYANSCVCSATRIALITGRYQQRLQVGLEEPINTLDPGLRLPPGHPTLPSLLRLAGYRTALIGKWHIGLNPAAGPLDYGYDRFFGYPGGGTNYYQQPNGGTPATPRMCCSTIAPRSAVRATSPRSSATRPCAGSALARGRSFLASISARRTRPGSRPGTRRLRRAGPIRSTAIAAPSPPSRAW
jgi:hypothetical protein